MAPDSALDLGPSPASFPHGFAGTTAAEQTRFRDLLADFRLRDVWRARNATSRDGMTWRGVDYVRARVRACGAHRQRACKRESELRGD